MRGRRLHALNVARRRAMRAVLFVAIALGAVGAFAAVRRGPRRPAALQKTPAGGAATEGAETDAIVEDARSYRVKTWTFGLDEYDVRIVDTGMTTALDTVLEKAGAELVVNGGFFDDHGKAMGLAVSGGVILSRLAHHLSGGVLVSDGTKATLFPSETFEADAAFGSSGGAATFAIQCRPRLVVDGAPNVKSDDGKRAERTALCTQEEGRKLVVVIVRGSEDGESPGPSLFALARHLARSGCESALNLDGGPSTGVAWREGENVRLLAPRGAVRHVVGLFKKSP